MKKMVAMALSMSLLLCSIRADQGGWLENNDSEVVCSQQKEKFQSYHDEYEQQFLSEDEDVAEYEQHVCDHVKPPKPSSISAIFTNIGCSLLIQYIAIREKAKVYLARLHNIIAKWFYAYT